MIVVELWPRRSLTVFIATPAARARLFAGVEELLSNVDHSVVEIHINPAQAEGFAAAQSRYGD